jgi:hypothetical protein
MANGDFLSNLGNAFSSGINNVTNAVGGEVQKMGQRTVKNVTQDFNEVADGIKKGGIVGGVASTVDVLSPGHQIVEAGDDLGLLPSDPNMKQLIAGGINGGISAALIATGNPIGLMLAADAIAEGVDGVGGMMKSGQAQTPATQTPMLQTPMMQTPTTQTPMAPSQGNIDPALAYADAHARALAEAKDKARAATSAYRQGYVDGERAQASRDHGGYGEPGYGDCGGDLAGRVGQYYGSNNTGAVNDSLQQILNDPNMSFEDKIFALLEGVVSDEQKKIEGDEAQLVGPNAPQDQDSRQQAAQKIQNEMNKLQEMQQALDGILSAMHETSMNTIRNIK